MIVGFKVRLCMCKIANRITGHRTDLETFALLDQWADETVQTELEGNPS